MSLAHGRPASSGWRRLTPLLLLLTSGACASILGIEEIQVDEDAGGSAGSGGTSDGNPSGGSNPKGGSSTTTAGKSAGGGNQPDGGAPTAGTGADGPGGSGSLSGSGGSGGSAPTTGKVHGRLIDVWGQTVAGVPVQIGDVNVSTDAVGEFDFDDVPATYTLSLAITIDGNEQHGYVYNGLTRRDPTLQVQRGWDFQQGYLTVSALDVTPDAGAGDVVSVGWTGRGVTNETTISQGGVSLSPNWLGPNATMPGVAQALWWNRDSVSELPTAYYAAAGTTFVLSTTTPATLGFNLAGSTLPPGTAGTIEGTVTVPTAADRVNKMFLRYDTGEVIELINQYSPAPNSFSFKAPDLPNATLTLSAAESPTYGRYGVVHKDGLAPGDAATLTVPTPATLTAPLADALVDGSTQFSFTPGSHAAKTYVVVIRAGEDSPYYDRLYIIGSETKFTIPQVLGADFVHAGVGYLWQVTTQGSAQTVDETAGPEGVFDSFGVNETSPAGPRTGDGEYTTTDLRTFTMKP